MTGNGEVTAGEYRATVLTADRCHGHLGAVAWIRDTDRTVDLVEHDINEGRCLARLAERIDAWLDEQTKRGTAPEAARWWAARVGLDGSVLGWLIEHQQDGNWVTMGVGS